MRAHLHPGFQCCSNEGIGLYQNTAKGGFRMSAARAYLPSARRRHNLTVIRERMRRGFRSTGARPGVEYVRNGKVEQACGP